MVEIFLYKVSSEGNTINVRPSCSDRKIKASFGRSAYFKYLGCSLDGGKRSVIIWGSESFTKTSKRQGREG